MGKTYATTNPQQTKQQTKIKLPKDNQLKKGTNPKIKGQNKKRGAGQKTNLRRGRVRVGGSTLIPPIAVFFNNRFSIGHTPDKGFSQQSVFKSNHLPISVSLRSCLSIYVPLVVCFNKSCIFVKNNRCVLW